MDLTKEEAIKYHRELWGWLADNPINLKYPNIFNYKSNWPGWEKNGGKFPDIDEHCFLCEYDASNVDFDGKYFCEDTCLLVWNSISSGCGSEFGNWCYAKTEENRRKYAILIRDLKERE